MKPKSECEQYLFSYELIDDQAQVEPLLQEAVEHLKDCFDCREHWEASQCLDKVIRVKFLQFDPSPALHARIVGKLVGYIQPASGIRQIIYETVCANPSHLSLKEIYQFLASGYPKKTAPVEVRRNLNWLVSRHQLLKLDFGEGFYRYDGNTNSHNHLFCEKCRKIFDLPSLSPAEISNLNTYGHQVTGIEMLLYGICKDCVPIQ